MGIKTSIIKTDEIALDASGTLTISAPVTFTGGTVGMSQIIGRGEWNGGSYSINDSVSYNGSSYICIQENSGYDPTNTGYWQILANKGNDGSIGDPGPQGPAGQDAQPIYNAYTDGNGNMYFQTAAGTFGPYFLQGPAGSQGVNGSNGVDGAVQIYHTGSGTQLMQSSGSNPLYLKGLQAGPNISLNDTGSVIEINGSGGGGIDEAPYDSNTYGRNNGNWVTVSGGGISGVDIYIDRSYQGNYSTLNFYASSGRSSGNNIYLGK